MIAQRMRGRLRHMHSALQMADLFVQNPSIVDRKGHFDRSRYRDIVWQGAQIGFEIRKIIQTRCVRRVACTSGEKASALRATRRFARGDGWHILAAILAPHKLQIVDLRIDETNRAGILSRQYNRPCRWQTVTVPQTFLAKSAYAVQNWKAEANRCPC